MNIFNEDFQEFLTCFNEAEVDYLLVGGYSVILHGYPRTTGDMDLWVKKNKTNYLKIENAFKLFKMPLFDMTITNFLSLEYDVFSFGKIPVKIDILTAVKGLIFRDSYKEKIIFELENDLNIPVINYNDLIKAKKAAGRFKDLGDIEQLENYTNE